MTRTSALEPRPSIFLSVAELCELTGYKGAKRQIAWLERNHIPHWVNGAGRPVVRSDFGAVRTQETIPALGAVT